MGITALLDKAQKLERAPMENITIKMPPWAIADAEMLAEETGTTFSDVCRTAMIDGLKQLRHEMD